MYEGDSPALIAHPDKELVPQIQEAVGKLPKGIARQSTTIAEPELITVELARAHHKEGSYQVSNGKVFQVRDGVLATPDFGEDRPLAKQAMQWIALREGAKELFARELCAQSSEQEVEAAPTLAANDV